MRKFLEDVQQRLQFDSFSPEDAIEYYLPEIYQQICDSIIVPYLNDVLADGLDEIAQDWYMGVEDLGDFAPLGQYDLEIKEYDNHAVIQYNLDNPYNYIFYYGDFIDCVCNEFGYEKEWLKKQITEDHYYDMMNDCINDEMNYMDGLCYNDDPCIVRDVDVNEIYWDFSFLTSTVLQPRIEDAFIESAKNWIDEDTQLQSAEDVYAFINDNIEDGEDLIRNVLGDIPEIAYGYLKFNEDKVREFAPSMQQTFEYIDSYDFARNCYEYKLDEIEAEWEDYQIEQYDKLPDFEE